ncbi:MAG: zf-HC2 domain-containing protein [Bryobacterales bacterium]|nr:zf-HC2 domain-containing protein [Bryobacterales bacterium]
MSEGHKHGPECKEVFALLSQYLDHELPEADCAEIDRHMAGCEPCIAFLNSLRRTVELCHGYAPVEQPAPLDAAVKQRLLDTYRRMVAARDAR